MFGGTSANRANSFAFSLHKLSRVKARLYYHVAIMTQRRVWCMVYLRAVARVYGGFAPDGVRGLAVVWPSPVRDGKIIGRWRKEA